MEIHFADALEVAKQAMRFYTNPPADLAIDKADLLAFAKQYANSLDVNSPLNAQKLAQQGRVDDALALAQADAAAHPDDLALLSIIPTGPAACLAE